eukprot:CAMPEP_0113723046 /NCGR_PEP_ID=MMETSP0038_2-20120614/38155_1 /TAXON_ID=2898 /ORGANISM="Cryptomonas paramecium" /LENGTH=1511 /DNA_ID=CAMNT_0000652491 /DNA_START=53 /DNA_END=4585 /DNA_ORIENTATION=- /assembly_acc=CAM_ASM_000170
MILGSLKQARGLVTSGLAHAHKTPCFSVFFKVSVAAPSAKLLQRCTTRAFASEVQRSNASGLVETGGGLGGTSGVSKRTDRKCTLVLEDGSVFSGQSFGAELSTAGEVVFNTGMVGYVENLTDPSYRGQILVSTYPLMGNYGVPHSPPDEIGLPTGMESDRIQVSALICQDYCHVPSHWNSGKTLSLWLKENSVPAMYGVDTRALTKKLRIYGSMKGKIVMDEDVPLRDPNMLNLVSEVSTRAPKSYGSGDVHIVAIDCGIKYNIIRSLVSKGVKVTVVPWNWDIKKERYDGLFVSNGPGDPAMCEETISNLRWAMQQEVPIFGICLGNQLLARAAGCKTYKLKFGNRGHNQPVKDMLTDKVYITPQNHGYAVDHSDLPPDWKPYFVNINDVTNEGLVHTTRPYFSVQFHPEASGGPEDTGFLFQKFIDKAKDYKRFGHTESIYQTGPYFRNKKVLILGSGGLQIGQAGEFDYSGSQAIKALKEEGCETILINPNIATVQTAKGVADKVYFLPVTRGFIEQIIDKERPDGIVLSFGGQTALNCGIELWQSGVLNQYNVRVLGTPVETVIAAEDRDIFKEKLEEIGEKLAPSIACDSIKDALAAAQSLKYPVICRAAFALGGLGSGFADNDEQLSKIVAVALSSSPQVLIERSIKGWKEAEYEVVRDAYDNCVTVCNMENFDPMGIHTGESIVVAPSQTLSNDEYHMLRTAAVKVIRHLGIIGECNIQYALDKDSMDYCIIEVNPASRASKATGYPLAAVAAKLALGIELEKIPNAVTKVTSAAFEPSLDYCVVKYPRWDLAKFDRVERQIGPQMRSVGEVMSIARDFTEGLQKAIRMVDTSNRGFEPKGTWTDEARDEELRRPTPSRIFALADAFYNAGYSVDRVHELTKIDRWFLSKLEYMAALSNDMSRHTIETIPRAMLTLAKRAGFSDRQIAARVKSDEATVRKHRKLAGVTPCVKQIDTLAAEFPAATNYLYMTYNGAEHDLTFEEHGTVVIGCGTYRIGSSVEFDFGSVLSLRTLRSQGKPTIMINCNPETVSTDYDESDRLYFEELSLERVLDIYEVEGATGCIVSFGGQIPNNLVMPLHKNGVKILGTAPESIDLAEDRQKHSAMLDSLGIDQPAWSELKTFEEADAFAATVGYPVLVRPSYVLSGAAMNVVRTAGELRGFLEMAADVSDDHPVVITKFIEGAEEIDVDAVADGGRLLAYAIAEHVEQGGVHSGDATLVLPARDMSKEVFGRIKEIAGKIAERLSITGPFNMQILHSPDGSLKVIETNVRASRSLPFSAKVLDVDFTRLATLAGLGLKPADALKVCDEQQSLPYVGVKVPQFSFKRLPGADPLLGVEMKSTGEVACFHHDKWGAYLRGLQSTYMAMPVTGSLVWLSLPPAALAAGDKLRKAVTAAKTLLRVGYVLAAGPEDVAPLKAQGVEEVSELAHKMTNGERDTSDYVKALKAREVKMVMELHNGLDNDHYVARRAAIDFAVPLVTNVEQAVLMSAALEKYGTQEGVVPR